MTDQDPIEALASPYAAVVLRGDLTARVFASEAALCGWLLDRKGRLKLTLSDGWLVWGDQDDEQRRVVIAELHDASGPVESLRIACVDFDAAALVTALKSERTRRKAVNSLTET